MDFFKGVVIPMVVITTLVVCFMLFVVPHQECAEFVEGTVLSVGGCDRYARCGVQTTIGHMSATEPAVGDVVHKCISRKWKFGF